MTRCLVRSPQFTLDEQEHFPQSGPLRALISRASDYRPRDKANQNGQYIARSAAMNQMARTFPLTAAPLIGGDACRTTSQVADLSLPLET